MSEWKKTREENPDLSGTQMGDLLNNLIALKAHFSSELEKEIEKLSYLEARKDILLTQRKKQRKDG